jgi:Ca2+-binding EF-hand superfamily protein
MLREKDKNAVFQGNLNREREDERIILQLQQEFASIDVNRDGVLRIDEIVQFLQLKGQADTSIAEAIFQEIDRDNNGVVAMDEFVYAYFIKQREIMDTITKLTEDIISHQKSRDQVLDKLRD